MNQECPRCKNTEHSPEANYCKICGGKICRVVAAVTTTTIKRKCALCTEKLGILHCVDDSWICETCAQVMSEMAPD